MEENNNQGQGQGQGRHGGGGGGGGETVRSRWTPKPEQILILESIFNSGMVNPPKDETVRIRKLLEKFGSVGDANVFYWFQNRRSRSRRRQRQLQASLAAAAAAAAGDAAQGSTTTTMGMGFNININNNNYPAGGGGGGGAIQLEGFVGNMSPASPSSSYNYFLSQGQGGASMDHESMYSSSSSSSLPNPLALGGGFEDAVVPTSAGGGGLLMASPSSDIIMCSAAAPASSSFLYQGGGDGGQAAAGFVITVFINGVATEVPRGPVDVRSMFGEDVVLFHSSGLSLPVNEFGFLLHGLQHGESYFLVTL
ncbi:unnamed protein product [Linum tenue]|uniref:Homeobox domain-containing protein n=1 Tax=Linum tenue TaxID=586396 RepID=A0AAV0HIF7_9ROSI|nr:unnamed protein product [Linum tenue]